MDKQSTNYIVDECNDGRSEFSKRFKEFRNGPEGCYLTYVEARKKFHLMQKQPITCKLTVEDFKKCQQKLLENDTYYRNVLQCFVNPHSLGTLPDSNKKENTMFRDQYDFDIPAPTPYGKTSVKTAQANIDLQVNMPPAKDPSETARNRLLERAGQASYEKRDEMRKAFNLIDDREPETLKDFIQRIKDGKFVTDLTEKEMAERTFWDLDRMFEEITWRDPARPADEAGFEAANVLLTNALNDVSDEIIVKTPEAGLEALRAFQAKTFH